MLQDIRDKSQTWIVKVIIGLIVVLLGFTGIDALVNTPPAQQSVAEINGEDVSRLQLQQAVTIQRNQLLQQLGGNIDPSMLSDELLYASALNGIIDRTILLQHARGAEMSFSDPMLDRVILQTPEFQVDGRFDKNRFDQVLTSMGYSRLQFRQLLLQEMLIGQLRSGIAGSDFITRPQVERYARLEQQSRDFAVLMLDPDPEQVELDDAAIEAYYDAHAGEFRTEEQVAVKYLELSKERFFDQLEVSDQELQALYQEEVADLQPKRRAAHILFEIGDQQSEEVARQKLAEVEQKLAEGADFAELAKAYSDDPGSAAQGGDLGFADAGVYAEPFEKALEGLEKDQISAPVQTEFGLHLIRLLDIQQPEKPTFAELRPSLIRKLKGKDVEQQFVEATKQLETLAYESSDLQYPAEQLGLEVRTSELFTQMGAQDGILANTQVIQAAFSQPVLEEGMNSDVLELDPDTVVVVRLDRHEPARQQTLDEVREQVTAGLTQQEAAKAVAERGEKLLDRLKAAQVDDLTEEGLPEWQLFEAATRSQEGVEPMILQQTFRMPHPAQQGQPVYAGLSINDGRYALIRLDGVSEPEAPLSEEEFKRYQGFLGSRSGQQQFAAFLNHLRATAEVERY